MLLVGQVMGGRYVERWKCEAMANQAGVVLSKNQGVMSQHMHTLERWNVGTLLLLTSLSMCQEGFLDCVADQQDIA